ncbi:hypothetical protein G7Y89_g6831 [Cudoniella acicularis]|uniref:MARVEL domain-containing protein n=1 Tax=Cudoniella acicularis TaxID=354080 RepID=A0A8H4W4D9_9HELO|nr:hypothetical protein G7Y89_g6831 [Cudoniella acicularis]
MVALVQTLLRGSQFLWTLLTTALIGNVISEAFAGNPSSINYAMFACAVSWVVLLYGLGAAFVESLANTIVLAVMDGLATVFTFIAGVVLAARLHVHSCGNSAYVLSNSLTSGSHNPTKRCHELQASTAFFWFLFASFAGSLIMDFIGSNSSMSRPRGGLRRGPNMSQV